MSNKREDEHTINKIENRFNVAGNLSKLRNDMKKYIEEESKKIDSDNTKAKLLRNLEIANNMFDKKSDIIFTDEELRVRAEALYNKIEKYI